MNEKLLEILSHFSIDTAPVSCELYGSGHINTTYRVETQSGRHYILQKVSGNVFKDIPALMENIYRVTEFIKAKVSDPRQVADLIPTDDGGCYIFTDGEYWRVFDFLEGALCLQLPESEEDFYQSAIGFGHFQQLLSDFPVSLLHETIPNFHNTPERFRQLREVIERDPVHRAAGVQREIEFAFAREAEMAALQKMRDSGELPERVTHNDTKLNNVLFDAKSRTALCVIDLDTVMPGLSLYDYGDSIRFGASTAAEDEKDLSRVSIDTEMFRVYTRGFLEACPSLTEREIDMLPMGAKTMTYENGIRFLADYIDGDNYYSISRPEHNLDRCRTQFKLIEDMEAKWDTLLRIVEEERRALK